MDDPAAYAHSSGPFHHLSNSDPRPTAEHNAHLASSSGSVTLEDSSSFPRENRRKSTIAIGRRRHVPIWPLFWMAACLLGGMLLAIAHHVVYTVATGKRKDTYDLSQAWLLRIGNGLAWGVGGFFGVAVGVAYAQWAWYDSFRTARTLGGIDALFAVHADAMALLNREMWKTAKTALVLGGIMRGFSLVSIATPAALTVSDANTGTTGDCSVPTFANTNEQVPNIATQQNENTDPLSAYISQAVPWGVNYNGPSLTLSTLAERVLVRGSYVSDWKSPCMSDAAANCTYTTRISAPAWKCEPGSAPGSIWPSSAGGSIASFWNATFIRGGGPNGSQDALQVHVPPSEPLFPTAGIIRCNAFEGTYVIAVSGGSNGQPFSVEYEAPVLGAPLASYHAGWPMDNDVRHYADAVNWTQAHMYAVNDAVMGLLSGTVGPNYTDTKEVTQADSKVVLASDMRLFNASAPLPNATALMHALPDLLANVSISLLSLPLPDFYVSHEICSTTHLHPIYVYCMLELLLPYAAAATCALLACALGVYALTNGDGRSYSSLSFASFVAASRDRGLDNLFRESDDGGILVPDEKGENTSLRYGRLRGRTTAGFGREQDVV